MKDYITEITLDLNCKKTPVTINSAQFDKGRKLRVNITADGASFDISDCTAILKGVRSDKTHLAIDCGIENDCVMVTFDDTDLSVKGFTVVKIVLSDSTRTYSTQTCIIDVDSSLEGDVTSADSYSILNRLIEQIHALNESGGILIEDELTDNGTNAVQSGAIKKYIDKGLSNLLTTKNSKNLFDCDSCEVLAAYVDKTILGGRIHSTVYLPCEPNTTYTVSKQLISQRFVVGETSVKPEIGVTVNQKFYNASGRSITITTSSTAKYIVIYYHKSDVDTCTEREIREGLMVCLGTTAGDYVPHHTYEIKKEVLPEEIQVLPEEIQILNGEVNKAVANNRFNTKSKIFGVVFDLSSDSSKGVRIADAVDLKNDYVIANIYQNGGVNNFDSIFPWCDMRKCNVKISDGIKTVTYEGEPNFALDGSNGEVMVEIPKFYSFRERVGNSEIWAITGEPKSGFTVEPAFDVDGKEIDYIYVAAYNWADERQNDAVSCSGSNPKNLISLHTLRTVAEGRGMSILDIATIHAIQMLYTIEFADRDNKAYMAGFGEAPYLKYSNSPVLETLSDTNVVTVNNSQRAANFRVGQRIKLCENTTLRSTSHHITKVELNEDTQVIAITFDGKSEDVVAGVTYLSSCPQRNGDCDNLIYHTGRISEDNGLSVFKYRHMENLWGNVWEMVDGIRVKNLNYYFTYDKTKYADGTVDNWEKYPIPAPEQPYLGDDGLNRAWITDAGYSIDNRLPILPSSCGNTGGVGKYFSGGIYTNYLIDRNGNTLEPDTEWMCVFGGGWDHSELCSPFTFRFFSIALNGGVDILHSTRIVLR